MAAERLDARLRKHFPSLAVGLEDNEPAGYRLVVSATPLGMSVGDPLPFDPARLDAVQSFYFKAGIIQKSTPVGDLYTNDFID